MSRILLVALLLLSFSSFAQDWAPFKSTDTIRHYSSTLNLNSVPPNRSQIQSVVVKSKVANGPQTTIVFKKGLTRSHTSIWQNQQLIKGQVFGDSALIINDSTVFETVDSLGFSLTFPNHYFLNQTFVIGRNHRSQKLLARVDSVYNDLVNNTMDSLVLITLSFIDSSGLVDSLSDYHDVEVIMSKNNGMIKGIDFTNLKSAVPVFQYFSTNDKFTKHDHFSLTTNDEYHYRDYTGLAGIGDRFNTIIRIVNDSTSGNLRTLTLEKRRQKVNPPPSGPITISVYNLSFDMSDEFVVFESQIIEDSSLTVSGSANWIPTKPKVNLFYPYNAQQLGLTVDSIDYNIFYSFITGRKDSIFYSGSALNYSYDHILIGVGDFGNYSYLGNNSWSHKIISYVKKGNQTWGTPLNLAVGLNEEIQDQRELFVYPNPVNETLRINSKADYLAIEILNTNGQLVASFAKQDAYDVSELSSGIYFLRMVSGESVVTRKFVKE